MGPRAMVEFEGMPAMPVLGLVAVDKPRDLAIAKIRVGDHRLPTVEIAQHVPTVGSDVFVVGSPLGLRQSVSRGIVSAIRAASDLESFGIVVRRTDQFIQIDAAISHGSSGGPIVAADGRAIATSTLNISSGQALNFGVPATYVGELLDVAGPCTALEHYARSPATPSATAKQSAPSTAIEANSPIEDVMRLFYLIALADGKISDIEQTSINNWLIQLGYFTADLEDFFARLIEDLGQSTGDDLAYDAADRLASVLSLETQDTLFEAFEALALADGLSDEETMILSQIALAWGRDLS